MAEDGEDWNWLEITIFKSLANFFKIHERWRKSFKPNLSLCPITKDMDNPVNQSKLEANTWSLHEARENVRQRVTIDFGFTSDWFRKWREFFLTNH